MQAVLPFVSNIKNSIWKVTLEEVLFPAFFVFVILLSNLALTSFPNVKFFDFFVFSAGYILGFRRGAIVAMVSWYIYGYANPWGPASFGLLTTLMLSEVIYAAAGAVCRKQIKKGRVVFKVSDSRLYCFWAAIICTTSYDLLTNIHTGLIWADLAGSEQDIYWISVSVFGPGALMFYMVHLLSNVFLFSTLGPVLVSRFTKSS